MSHLAIPRRRLQPYRWNELDLLPKRKALVKRLLDRNALSLVFGESNCGKTFFVLDIALHIVLGRNWQERKVQQAPIVYIACEGGLSLQERLEAFRVHHGIHDDGLFYLIPSGIDLCSDKNDTRELIEEIQNIDGVELVVVDTLSRALSGGNENSPDDMGAFIKNCDEIRQSTGAHVMVIHHSGKDSARGARGHSALRAAVDSEIEITKRDGIVTAEVKKQRDGRTGDKFHFSLEPVKIGEDDDGETITSCVLLDANPPDKKALLSGNARKAHQILLNLMLESSFLYSPKKGMPPKKCVKAADFKDCFKKAGIVETDKPDSANKGFSRAKTSLIDAGCIAEWDGYIWILDKADK